MQVVTRKFIALIIEIFTAITVTQLVIKKDLISQSNVYIYIRSVIYLYFILILSVQY